MVPQAADSSSSSCSQVSSTSTLSAQPISSFGDEFASFSSAKSYESHRHREGLNQLDEVVTANSATTVNRKLR